MNAPLPAMAHRVSGTPFVRFAGVSKSYDGVTASVRDLDLQIARGEFLTLLGPSGSGKTTTLMMLAGFEAPTTGEILVDGRSITDVPPHARNMGVVFQSYALFPHMTVAENIAFPLDVRGIRGKPTQTRVSAMLDLVQLADLGHRKPASLSGGQQQRVALARALVFEPEIVLMDEPCGALDRHLRERMQQEIKRLHRQLGVTIIYVTHDQAEALALSDRIAVFAGGRLQQIAAPDELYARPANAFVAGFVGDNNMVSGVVRSTANGFVQIEIAEGVAVGALAIEPLAPGAPVVLAIRPEHIGIDRLEGTLANRLRVTVTDCAFHGDHYRVRAALPTRGEIWFRASRPVPPGELTTVVWQPRDCLAFADGRAVG